MASVASRPKSAPISDRPETVADLLRRLGNIPAHRVRLQPAPGTATEKDLIRNNESLFRTAICELVDGTLVEKPMGWQEAEIAGFIIQAMLNYVRPRKLGRVLPPDGMLRLVPGLLRAPDVSFVARGKLSGKTHREQRIPSVAADLAVEVMSKSNSKPEIARKLVEYFAAGTRLAWVVAPKTMTVRVHTSPREWVVLGLDDVLDGGDVLPGFQLAVRDVFDLEDD